MRLVTDDDGAEVLAIADALAKADEAGLDLVEISPNAKPPVVKILGLQEVYLRAEKEEKGNAIQSNEKLL